MTEGGGGGERDDDDDDEEEEKKKKKKKRGVPRMNFFSSGTPLAQLQRYSFALPSGSEVSCRRKTLFSK
jgi:hypothetical protein